MESRRGKTRTCLVGRCVYWLSEKMMQKTSGIVHCSRQICADWWTDRQTVKRMDGRMDRHTYRQTDRQADKQLDTERNRQKEETDMLLVAGHSLV